MYLRSVSILLCIIFLNSLAGKYITFFIMHYELRAEVKNKLKSGKLGSNDELYILTVDAKDEKNLITDEGEIIIEGNYYDVIRTSCAGGKISYFCYPDKIETDLVKNFIDQTEWDTQSTKGLMKIIYKSVIEVFQATIYKSIFFNLYLLKITQLKPYLIHYSIFFSATIFYPPKDF